MRKRDKAPQLLTDQEPPKKRGLLRVIELIDRDSGKFFKAGLLALPGMALFFMAVQLALANASPVLLLLCVPIGMLSAPQLAGAADTVMRSKRDEVGWWWWDTYKAVWKRSFTASLLPGALGALLLGAQVYCLYYRGADPVLFSHDGEHGAALRGAGAQLLCALPEPSPAQPGGGVGAGDLLWHYDRLVPSDPGDPGHDQRVAAHAAVLQHPLSRAGQASEPDREL